MILPEQIEELRQKRYNGTVASIHKAHQELMILRVKSDFPRPAHMAGQYCTLGLGNWEPRFPGAELPPDRIEDETKLTLRAYSLSCSMLDDDKKDLLRLEQTDYIEFYITMVREGALTPRLFMLKQGDRLSVGKKITGHYNLEPVKDGENVLFLGTGTGEAPHNYMLWELLKRGHTGKILNASCVRYTKDLAYRDTHHMLMERYPNYKYVELTTREAHSVNQKVYIQDSITSGQMEAALGDKLDPSKTHVYLCGNPKMIGIPVSDHDSGHHKHYPTPVGVIEILEGMGFKADDAAAKFHGNIHFEKYW